MITPAPAPIPVGDVASIENKHLLWAILTEEQVFNGIREDKAPAIINIFETAINTVKNARTNMDNDLASLNKDVIRRVIADITRYKSTLGLNETGGSGGTDTNETNYKAADMHESRIRDITSKLKLHEDDMKSFLVLKKPAEINFADARANDDRPIGEEMDQLIQAALASRARELEIMQFQPQSPDTTATLTTTPTTPATPNSTPTTHSINDKKTVSFTNAIIGGSGSGDIEEGANSSDIVDIDTTFNINTIVNKLKRAATTPTDAKILADNNDSELLLQTMMRSITEIQRELRDIKNLLLGAATRA